MVYVYCLCEYYCLIVGFSVLYWFWFVVVVLLLVVCCNYGLVLCLVFCLLCLFVFGLNCCSLLVGLYYLCCFITVCFCLQTYFGLVFGVR